MELEHLLQARFGFSAFRPGQKEAIEHALKGERVLLIQPTGWGKSLVYQMIALRKGLTVVFSPLRALMRDQVRQAGERYGLSADTVNSDMDIETQRVVLERAMRGELHLLFVAPERLENEIWQEYVMSLPIRAVVIDEAHCVSIWGHDFRPDYRRIVTLVRLLPPETPMLAVTATATPRVEADIRQQLGEPLLVLRGNLMRPNLRLFVVHVASEEQKRLWVLHLLQQLSGTGLVYCATRDNTMIVSQFLEWAGIDAPYYHAGLESERLMLEQKLIQNRIKVLVCTNALGMGIDKPDLRFIIHAEFPASPLHYYQEIGRAGRDGKPAYAVLLYDPDDLRIQEFFIETGRPPSTVYHQILALLHRQPMREHDILMATGLGQSQVRAVLNDLQEQGLIVRDTQRYYRGLGRGSVDLSQFESLYRAKRAELQAILDYVSTQECRMQYLCHYLGDSRAEPCGVCDRCLQHTIAPYTEEFAQRWSGFRYHPPLPLSGSYQKEPIYRAGFALDFYKDTRVGQAIQRSKYTTHEPLPSWLLIECANMIRQQYPIGQIEALVPIPSTRATGFLDAFVQDLARLLGKPALHALFKARPTRLQKDCTNFVQKRENLRDAFALQEAVAGKCLLVVDDVCDSGITLEVAGKILKQNGAGDLYAFAIARTRHRGDI